jgi:hypothetical protein
MGADDLMNVASIGHENANFALEMARGTPERGQLRWYVAPIVQGWTIGTTPFYAPTERHPLLNIHDEPVVFSSVESALQFLREELQIYSVAVIHC